MAIEVDFGPLDHLLTRRGIVINPGYRLPPLRPLPFSQKELEKLETGELIENIGALRRLNKGDGRPLSDRGVGLLVYIMYTRETLSYLRARPATDPYLPRVHLVWCTKLDKMNKNGSYEARYVKTSRHDGKFRLASGDGKEVVRGLNVCRYCLGCIIDRNSDGSSPSNFDFKGFFATHHFKDRYQKMPTNTDINSPISGNSYLAARRYKETKNWTCSECHVNCREHQHLLQRHHKDRNPSNDEPSNLEALCIVCHAKEHPHMPSSLEDYEVFESEIMHLRREQGLISA